MWSRFSSGERGPAGLELDADGAPVEEGGLDDRGADPGERVDDELRRGVEYSVTMRRASSGSILPGWAVQAGR